MFNRLEEKEFSAKLLISEQLLLNLVILVEIDYSIFKSQYDNI